MFYALIDTGTGGFVINKYGEVVIFTKAKTAAYFLSNTIYDVVGVERLLIVKIKKLAFHVYKS